MTCIQINHGEPGSQPSEGPAPLQKGMSAVSSGLVAAPVSAIMCHSLCSDCQNSFSPAVFFRESLDKLSQRGQLLSEEGTVLERKPPVFPALTSYQNLLRMTREAPELPGWPCRSTRPWRRRCRAHVVLGEGHAGQTWPVQRAPWEQRRLGETAVTSAGTWGRQPEAFRRLLD